MKELQSQTSQQLIQRRSKVDSALFRITKLVSTPPLITNNNLRHTVEETAILPQQDRLANIVAVGQRRREIHQKLQEKTEPRLISLLGDITNQIEERKAELETSTPFLDEKGVFALASIWASNPSLAVEHGVEPLPEQVVLNLRSLIGKDSLPTQEQHKEIAALALEKILEVVNSDKLDQVYDSQPPPVQDLLLHFTTINPESVVNFLNKALSECDETVQPATLAEPTADKMPESPKLKEIERRDPQIRQTLNTYFDRIEQVTDKPIYRSQLTRFFPQIKANFIDLIERDKVYITPQKGKDRHHPVFSKEEIAILFYLKEYGKNLDPRRIKELKKIVAEEIAKRGQNNGNKNGVSKDQSSPRVAIDQPQGPRVNGPKPAYSLEISKTEDEREIPEQDLTAINLYIENPQIALSEVIAVLGEGETLISDQILSRLIETASKLYERNAQGAASQAEIDVWEKIKNKTKMGENKDALREFRSAVKAWSQSQKKLQEQTNSITDVKEEAENETEAVVAEVREEENADVPSAADTELVLPIKIIPEPTAYKRPASRGLRGFLNRFTGVSSREYKIREGIQAITSVSAHEIQEINLEDYRLQIEKALLERPDAKLTTMDKKHPNVRTMIYFYFDSFNKIKNWPINTQYLPQTGPGPSIEFISKLFDEGILTKNNTDDPLTFSKSDAAIVFFALHHGLKLTKTYIEDLRQIIKDEEYWDNLRNSD